MKNSRYILYPILAAALLVTACAEQREAAVQEQAGKPSQRQPNPLLADATDRSWIDNYDPNDRIFFDFDSAVLRPDAVSTIDTQAEWLKRYARSVEEEPHIKFMIEGHTDYSGPEDNSIELGCRRAKALRDALIERGIAAERLGTVSYGDSRPAVLGKNEAAWRQNRRAVLVVLSGDHVLGVGGSYCGER